MNFEDDLGVHIAEMPMDVQGKLLERFEEGATSLALTEYAIELGLTPPSAEPGWILAILRLEGRNRGGERMADFNGFVWSAPGYAFSHGVHHDLTDDDPSVWEPSGETVQDDADSTTATTSEEASGAAS